MRSSSWPGRLLYAIICWNVASNRVISLFICLGPGSFVWEKFRIRIRVLDPGALRGFEVVALTNIPVAGREAKNCGIFHVCLRSSSLERWIRVAQVLKFQGRRFAWQWMEGRGKVFVVRLKCTFIENIKRLSHTRFPFQCFSDWPAKALDAIRFDCDSFREFFRLARDKTQLMPALKFTLPG